jgi:hypothetical protein
MGGFLVQRVALCEQFFELGLRVIDLQQRALAVVAQSAKNLFRTDAQVTNSGALVQHSAVGGSEYRTAAGGQYAMVLTGDFLQNLALHIPKRCLALALKILFDATTQALFDELIGVDEIATNPAGNLPPDC